MYYHAFKWFGTCGYDINILQTDLLIISEVSHCSCLTLKIYQYDLNIYLDQLPYISKYHRIYEYTCLTLRILLNADISISKIPECIKYT